MLSKFTEPALVKLPNVWLTTAVPDPRFVE